MKQIALFLFLSVTTFLLLILFDGAKYIYSLHGWLGVCVFVSVQIIIWEVMYFAISLIMKFIDDAFTQIKKL